MCCGEVTAFGERLRRLRVEAGLTQAQLADDDLSTSYISLLEGGKRSPSGEVVQQLAVRLGCSTTRLLDGQPSERDQRIQLEMAYARLAVEHGESAEARRRLEELLAEDGLAQRARDDLNLMLGTACERSGDLFAATEVFMPLFERARAGLTHVPVSFIGLSLCGCYFDAGDLRRATRVGELALEAARAQRLTATDDYYRLAATVMDAYTALGDYLHARVWAEAILSEARGDDRQVGQAAIYWNLAILAENEGRLAEALHLSERALGLMGELENTRDYARLRLDVAWTLLADDPPQTARAADLLARTVEDLRDLGSKVDLAKWNQASSTTRLYEGDSPTAEARARQALDLAHGAGATVLAGALTALSDALAAQSRDQQADEARVNAVQVLGGVPSTRATALQWRELAERLAETGNIDVALEAFRRALDGAGVRDRSRALREQVAALRARPMVPAAPN